MNNGGFTLIGISFLILPLFLSCMVVIGSFHLIERYTDIQKICRSHVLSAQKSLGKKLMDLMDLNPKAQGLRAEEATLQKAIAIALVTHPPAAIPFQKLLEINHVRQAILRGKQEKIIATATITARKSMETLYSDFPKQTHFKYSNIFLKVYKKPLTAIAPDHFPLPYFTDLQTIQVSWKIPTDNFIPNFLLGLFPNGPSQVRGECAATLLKKGDVWNPKLHQARF